MRTARLLRESGRSIEAVDLLKEQIERVSELHNRAIIYVALAELYQQGIPADMDSAFAMFELALLNNPGNSEARFAAAYAYQQHGQSAMAFFHYWETLGHESDALARNNAGVAARTLKLPILATKLQRQAADGRNTLAAGNLAFELIAVGFVAEVDAILAAAKQVPNPDERVHLAEAHIITAKTNEEQSRKTLQTNYDLLTQWRQKQARAILTAYSGDFDGSYLGGNVVLQIRASLNAIEGTLSIAGEPRRATLTGTPNGMAVHYTWKTERPADNAWYLPEDGYGVLIFQTPIKIVGYRQKGTSRDAFDLGGFVEFTLTKSSEPS